MSSRPPVRGAVLAEALVALTLGALVLTLVATTLLAFSGWSRRLVARADALEATRTVWVMLGEELRAGRRGVDWALGPEGVLELRAFRGVARVCGASDGSGGWPVVYRGRRPPDPDRDSVLVLGSDGAWRVRDLVRVSPTEGCPGAAAERVDRWRWAPDDGPSPVLARLFERGSYHLANGAFRYRQGGGGRQPLTPELFSADSRFLPGGSGLKVELVVDAGDRSGAPRRHSWTVRGMRGSP